jgi:hypothetical protein
MTHSRFRLVAAALAVTLGASVAACTDDDSAREPTTPRPAVSFEARFTRTPTELSWAYRLRNDESVPLYVFNGPVTDYPTGPPAVWITPRDDRTVEVGQRLLGPPEGVEQARPILVHGTTVAPGAEITQTVRASLPLATKHPYQDVGEPPLPDDIERVVFCVGVARQGDILPQPTDPPTGSPSAAGAGPTPAAGPVFANLTGAEARQHLFCSKAEELRG